MAKFKILSLDGGGVRGAFTAAFLSELEREIGKPIAEHFDLIAGTSTGGIIATALAMGEGAHQIQKFYQDRAPRIFQRRRPLQLGRYWIFGRLVDWLLARRGMDINLDGLLQSKYDGKELRAALDDMLGTRTFANAITRLVVPAVDLGSGKPTVFKTPHLRHAASRDRRYLATDIVMATTAAPTYFPHAAIGEGSAYCDGGLWANNPSLVAYTEAMMIRRDLEEENRHPGFSLDEILILSIGTGEPRYSMLPPATGGLGWWGPRIVDTLSISQSQSAEQMASLMLGPQRYHRINYQLPDSTWKLDSAHLINQLVQFGQKEAHTHLARLVPLFFDEPVVPFEHRSSVSPVPPRVSGVELARGASLDGAQTAEESRAQHGGTKKGAA